MQKSLVSCIQDSKKVDKQGLPYPEFDFMEKVDKKDNEKIQKMCKPIGESDLKRI
jgi:hypothetical protein